MKKTIIEITGTDYTIYTSEEGVDQPHIDPPTHNGKKLSPMLRQNCEIKNENSDNGAGMIVDFSNDICMVATGPQWGHSLRAANTVGFSTQAMLNPPYPDNPFVVLLQSQWGEPVNDSTIGLLGMIGLPVKVFKLPEDTLVGIGFVYAYAGLPGSAPLWAVRLESGIDHLMVISEMNIKHSYAWIPGDQTQPDVDIVLNALPLEDAPEIGESRFLNLKGPNEPTGPDGPLYASGIIRHKFDFGSHIEGVQTYYIQIESGASDPEIRIAHDDVNGMNYPKILVESGVDPVFP